MAATSKHVEGYGRARDNHELVHFADNVTGYVLCKYGKRWRQRWTATADVRL
jgi:hypothetical protein